MAVSADDRPVIPPPPPSGELLAVPPLAVAFERELAALRDVGAALEEEFDAFDVPPVWLDPSPDDLE
jgi:hypothetical protein